jgi:aspartyl-tRNA(Asn)/glutamyl-tRNA(Gln) amidotransferase subunit B
MPPQHIAEVLELLGKKTINRTVAKQVFEESFQSGGSPAQIVQAKGLTQISDTDKLVQLAQEVIAEHQDAVEQYRKGKTTAVQFLVGQMMRKTRGQANPQSARELLEAELNRE